MKNDRIFGTVVIFGALAYIAGALQIQTSFMSDPVGSKTFPILLGAVGVLTGLVMVLRPDEDPDWPDLGTLAHIAIATAAMVAYAYTLKPLGFLLPTAVTAAVLSYQIAPRLWPSVATGFGLSAGLFVIFKFFLGLGLQPWPKALLG